MNFVFQHCHVYHRSLRFISYKATMAKKKGIYEIVGVVSNDLQQRGQSIAKNRVYACVVEVNALSPNAVNFTTA